MTSSTPARAIRGLTCGAALVAVSLSMGACTHTSANDEVTASVPNDYRQRHPIAIQEADRSVVVFVGNGRGGLTATQRADVAAFGKEWLREGTGSIIAEVPSGTPNARAASDTMREIQSLLTSGGVPARGVIVKPYQPADPRSFAAIRLLYPKVAAVAGPCGLWPEDIGPSIKNKGYLDNKPYWNFGCANQRNLAAMVENPSDLVQPRPETPAYTARRGVTFETYRTTKPEATAKAQVSNVGP
ncbi:Type IV pili component-like [Rhodopseudomonas palustris HaA2]|uniref:Type IV pili component-like n=1 Tax=Rhodopseudomonas palustris (strain HaA2) TaxID=316058 RepID=Q2IZ69_RHOP2|nr:CpaD family pilus assembly protein [Rhodopseudomonas palustris]ABD06491.1 Type IV pili component-like [Rhodopseudomonas palustris HaA2]